MKVPDKILNSRSRKSAVPFSLLKKGRHVLYFNTLDRDNPFAYCIVDKVCDAGLILQNRLTQGRHLVSFDEVAHQVMAYDDEKGALDAVARMFDVFTHLANDFNIFLGDTGAASALRDRSAVKSVHGPEAVTEREFRRGDTVTFEVKRRTRRIIPYLYVKSSASATVDRNWAGNIPSRYDRKVYGVVSGDARSGAISVLVPEQTRATYKTWRVDPEELTFVTSKQGDRANIPQEVIDRMQYTGCTV